MEPVTCPATAYQRATVCVPVAVQPFATPLPTTTVCCGVPVEFGANTRVGGPFVQCGQVTNEDICTDCNDIAGLTGGCLGCK